MRCDVPAYVFVLVSHLQCKYLWLPDELDMVEYVRHAPLQSPTVPATRCACLCTAYDANAYAPLYCLRR